MLREGALHFVKLAWFGEPLHFEGDPTEEDSVVEAKVEAVKEAMRALLKRGLEEREAIFW